MWGMLAAEFSAGGFCSELIFMVVLYVVLVVWFVGFSAKEFLGVDHLWFSRCGFYGLRLVLVVGVLLVFGFWLLLAVS